MADNDKEEKQHDSVTVSDDRLLENDTAAEKRLVRKTDLLMMPGLGETHLRVVSRSYIYL